VTPLYFLPLSHGQGSFLPTLATFHSDLLLSVARPGWGNTSTNTPSHFQFGARHPPIRVVSAIQSDAEADYSSKVFMYLLIYGTSESQLAHIGQYAPGIRSGSFCLFRKQMKKLSRGTGCFGSGKRLI